MFKLQSEHRNNHVLLGLYIRIVLLWNRVASYVSSFIIQNVNMKILLAPLWKLCFMVTWLSKMSAIEKIILSETSTCTDIQSCTMFVRTICVGSKQLVSSAESHLRGPAGDPQCDKMYRKHRKALNGPRFTKGHQGRTIWITHVMFCRSVFTIESRAWNNNNWFV